MGSMVDDPGSPPAHNSPGLVISGLALANPNVGQGVYGLRLIEGLLKKTQRDFLVVATSSIKRPPQIPEEHFLTIPPIHSPRADVVQRAVSSHYLLRYVAQEFPNAIFHSPGPIWGLVRPRRTVITLHDCVYRHFSNYDGRLRLRRLLNIATERFAAGALMILTDSEFSRRDLVARANMPSCKIEVLYPWVANAFLKEISQEDILSLRARLELPPRFWLYLGGYDFRKNVPLLLEAYALALRSRALPPLVLAGDVPKLPHASACDVMGALDRLKIHSEQIRMTGIVPSRDLPILYRAASLLIYPSLMEGFGLPPAEAMAVGTPVLASNNSSLPEVVERADCRFDATNAAELAAKLLIAAGDEKEFTCALPQKFTEDFGAERYRELLGIPEGAS